MQAVMLIGLHLEKTTAGLLALGGGYILHMRTK